MGMAYALADTVGNDSQYDTLIHTVADSEQDAWILTLAEAGTRFGNLQRAVFELRHLCESEDVRSEQVLEVLERHGA